MQEIIEESPCRRCTERQVFEHYTCHAICGRYKKWREKLDKRKTTIADAEVMEFIIDSISRKRRAKR